MARTVIAADGTHYKLSEDNSQIILAQYIPGGRWKTYTRCQTDEIAAEVLASLGRLIPPAELPEWAQTPCDQGAKDGEDATD